MKSAGDTKLDGMTTEKAKEDKLDDLIEHSKANGMTFNSTKR